MKVLWIFVTSVLAVKAHYHDEVGIPLAARIKAFEDQIFANRSDKHFRLVGSEIASVFAHPFMVGLLIKLQTNLISTCGSSLVTASRLVTAAHCFFSADYIMAVLGTPFLYHGGTRMTTREFIQHPKFDGLSSKDYDIAIVKLPQAVEMSGTLHPIRLPANESEAEIIGERAMALGWGLTKDNQRGVEKGENSLLMEVSLEIIPEKVCEETYNSYNVTGNAVCTSGAGGVGACDGDSGGALFVNRNGRKILVGVISHGHEICEGSFPTVSTRVMTYRNFILQV